MRFGVKTPFSNPSGVVWTGSWFVHDVYRCKHGIVFHFSRRIICLLNVHSHHGDNHHETNMTVKAAILHTAGDVLHSFAVLVGAILIKINVS